MLRAWREATKPTFCPMSSRPSPQAAPGARYGEGMTITANERAAMCDLFDELGPDAPTLCEGWTTRDLLAHLLVRERRLDAAAGIVLPFLAGYTERVMATYAAEPYADMIEQFRDGPPIWSPWAIPVLGDKANLAEFFVHHEDIRRAQPTWEPRADDSARDDALWNPLKMMGRLLFRKSPVGVVLRSAGRDDIVVKKGEPRRDPRRPARRDRVARVRPATRQGPRRRAGRSERRRRVRGVTAWSVGRSTGPDGLFRSLFLQVSTDVADTRSMSTKLHALHLQLHQRAVVLDDRKVPGTKVHIDHIVVAPSGVWVIDAKESDGRVERRDIGGWFKVDERLYVAGKDRTEPGRQHRSSSDRGGAGAGEGGSRPRARPRRAVLRRTPSGAGSPSRSR